jgi:anaerobic ribonucleoside-triphosphate reductase activating protein
VAELAGQLALDAVDGVTISGGEPFQQVEELTALCAELRARGVESILVFSGYTLDEIQTLAGGAAVLGKIDAVIAGRYQAKEAIGDSILASSNQRLHLLTQRHTADEFECGGAVEITIAPDGQVTMTGFPSAGLARAVQKMGSER